ncbi:hypothetical protein Avbf_00050 [Armadillidium vulgare]|nr:hypothetical protein Avbf_00050 [Armadillidium vulgare]
MLVVQETISSGVTSEFKGSEIPKEQAERTLVPFKAPQVITKNLLLEEKPKTETVDMMIEIEKHITQTAEVMSSENIINLKEDNLDISSTATVGISEAAKVPLSSDVMVIEKEGIKYSDVLETKRAETNIDLCESIVITDTVTHHPVNEENLKINMPQEKGICDVIESRPVNISEIIVQEKEDEYISQKLSSVSAKQKLEQGDEPLIIEETLTSQSTTEYKESDVPKEVADSTIIPYKAAPIQSEIETSDKEKVLIEEKPNSESAEIDIEVQRNTTQISEVSSHETSVEFKEDKPDLSTTATVGISEAAKVPLSSDVMVVEKEGIKGEEIVESQKAEAKINLYESVLVTDTEAQHTVKPENLELVVSKEQGTYDIIESRPLKISEVITQEREDEYSVEKLQSVTAKSKLEQGDQPLIVEETLTSQSTTEYKESDVPKEKADSSLIPFNAAALMSEVETSDKEKTFIEEKPKIELVQIDIELERNSTQISEVSSHETSTEFKEDKPDLSTTATVGISEAAKVPLSSDVMVVEKEGIKGEEIVESQTAETKINLYESVQVTDTEAQHTVKPENLELVVSKEQGTYDIIESRPLKISEVITQEREDEYSVEKLQSVTAKSKLEQGDQPLIVEETLTSQSTTEYTESDVPKEKADSTLIPFNAAALMSEVETSDKEKTFIEEKPKGESVQVDIELERNSTQISEVSSHETSTEFKEDKPDLSTTATVGISEAAKVPLSSDVMVVEKEGIKGEEIVESQTAETKINLYESVQVTDTEAQHTVKPENLELVVSKEQGTYDIIESRPLKISEVITQEREDEYSVEKLQSVTAKSKLEQGDQPLIVEETLTSQSTTEYKESDVPKEKADSTLIPFNAAALMSEVETSDKEKTFIEEKPKSESIQVDIELERNSTQISEVSSHETSTEFKEDKPDLSTTATVGISEAAKVPLSSDVMVVEKEGIKGEEIIESQTAETKINLYESVQVTDTEAQHTVKPENLELVVSKEQGTYDIIESRPLKISEVITQEREDEYSVEKLQSVTAKSKLEQGDQPLIVEETLTSQSTTEYKESDVPKEKADSSLIPFNAAALMSEVETSDKEKTFIEEKPKGESVQVDIELERNSTQISEVSSHETSTEFKEDKPDLSTTATVGISEAAKVPLSSDVMVVEKEGIKGEEIVESQTAETKINLYESVQVTDTEAQHTVKPENLELVVSKEQGTYDIIESRPLKISEIITQEREDEYSVEKLQSVNAKSKLEEGDQPLIVEETLASQSTTEYTESDVPKEKADSTMIPFNAAALMSEVETSDKEKSFVEEKPKHESADVDIEVQRNTTQISEVSSHETSVEFKEDKPDLSITATVGISEAAKVPLSSDVLVVEKEGIKGEEAVETQTAESKINLYESILVTDTEIQHSVKPENLELIVSKEQGTYDIVELRPLKISEVITQEMEDEYSIERRPSISAKPLLEQGDQPLIVEETLTSHSATEYKEFDVPKEMADSSLIPFNAAALTSEVETSEKEKTFIEEKPKGESVQVDIQLERNTTQISEVSSHETSTEFKDDKPDLSTTATVGISEAAKVPLSSDVMVVEKEGIKGEEAVETQTAESKINLYESILVTDTEAQHSVKPENLELIFSKEQGTCDIIESRPLKISEVITQEREDEYSIERRPSISAKPLLEQGDQPLIVEETLTSQSTTEYEESEILKEKADSTLIPFNAAALMSEVETSDKEKMFIEERPKGESVQVDIELERNTTQISEVSSHETSIDFKDGKPDLSTTATVGITEARRVPLSSDVLVVEKEGVKDEETVETQKAETKINLYESVLVTDTEAQHAVKPENLELVVSKEQGTYDLIESRPLKISEVISQDKEDVYTVETLPSIYAKSNLEQGDQPLQIEEVVANQTTVDYQKFDITEAMADSSVIPFNAVPLLSQVETSLKEERFTCEKPITETSSIDIVLEKPTFLTSEISSQDTSLEFEGDKPDLGQNALVSIGELHKIPLISDVNVSEKESYKWEEIINEQTATPSHNLLDSLLVSETITNYSANEENLAMPVISSKGSVDVIPSKIASVSEFVTHDKENIFTPEIPSFETVNEELQSNEQALIVEETVTSSKTIDYKDKDLKTEIAEASYVPSKIIPMGLDIDVSDKEQQFVEEKPKMEAANVNLEVEMNVMETSLVSSHETSRDFTGDKPDLTQRAEVTIDEAGRVPMSSDIFVIEKEGYKDHEKITEETATSTFNVQEHLFISESQSNYPLNEADLKLHLPEAKGNIEFIPSKLASVSEITLHDKEKRYDSEVPSSLSIKGELQPAPYFEEKETIKEIADQEIIPFNIVPVETDIQTIDKENVLVEELPKSEIAGTQLETEKHTTQTFEIISRETSKDFIGDKPDLGQKANITLSEAGKVPLSSAVMIIEKEGNKEEETLSKQKSTTSVVTQEHLLVSETELQDYVNEANLEITMSETKGIMDIIPSKTISISEVILHDKEKGYSPSLPSLVSIQGEIYSDEQAIIVQETLTSVTTEDFKEEKITSDIASQQLIPHNLAPLESSVQTSEKEVVFSVPVPKTESAEVNLEYQKHITETSEVSSQETSRDFEGDKPDLTQKAVIALGEAGKVPLSTSVLVSEKESYKSEDNIVQETADVTFDTQEPLLVSELQTQDKAIEDTLHTPVSTAQGNFEIIPSKTASVSEVTLHEKEKGYEPQYPSTRSIKGEFQITEPALVVQETVLSSRTDDFIDADVTKHIAKQDLIPLNLAPVTSATETSEKESILNEEKPMPQAVDVNLEYEKHMMQTYEASSHETSRDFEGSKPDLTQKAIITIGHTGKIPLSSDIMIIEKEDYTSEESRNLQTADTSINAQEHIQITEVETQYPLNEELSLQRPKARGIIDIIPSKTASITEVTLHEKEKEYEPDLPSASTITEDLQPGEQALVILETLPSITASDFKTKELDTETIVQNFVSPNIVPLSSDVLTSDKESYMLEKGPELESADLTLEYERHITETSEVSSHETSRDFVGDKPDLSQKPNITLGEPGKIPVSSQIIPIEREEPRGSEKIDEQHAGKKIDTQEHIVVSVVETQDSLTDKQVERIPESASGDVEVISKKTVSVSEVYPHEKEQLYLEDKPSQISIDSTLQPAEQPLVVEEVLTSFTAREFIEEVTERDKAQSHLIPFNVVPLSSDIQVIDQRRHFT